LGTALSVPRNPVGRSAESVGSSGSGRDYWSGVGRYRCDRAERRGHSYRHRHRAGLHAKTDSSGNYVFSPLKIGAYKVEVSAPGFNTGVPDLLYQLDS